MTQEQMHMRELFATDQNLMNEVGKQMYLSALHEATERKRRARKSEYLQRMNEALFEKLMSEISERMMEYENF